jgi:hypothetical protein
MRNAVMLLTDWRMPNDKCTEDAWQQVRAVQQDVLGVSNQPAQLGPHGVCVVAIHCTDVLQIKQDTVDGHAISLAALSCTLAASHCITLHDDKSIAPRSVAA